MALTDVLEHVDHEEWRDQVVDALHVAAGRVADGPNEQDPLKNLTHTRQRVKSVLGTKHIHITQTVYSFTTLWYRKGINHKVVEKLNTSVTRLQPLTIW